MIVVLALLAIPLAVIVSVAFWIALSPRRTFSRLAAVLACSMAMPVVFAFAFLMEDSVASDSEGNFVAVVGIYLGLAAVACLIAIAGSWLFAALRSR